MKRRPKISESEWKVMEVIWETHPITTREIFDSLSSSEVWKSETVKTLITRLTKKGYLSFEKQGNRHVYSPKVERNLAVSEETESFFNRISRGSIAPLLSHLIESKDQLTREDLDELRRLLDSDSETSKDA